MQKCYAINQHTSAQLFSLSYLSFVFGTHTQKLKLTQCIILLRVEKRSERRFRRGSNWDAVNVLSRLFAAWKRLKFLEERVEVTFTPQYTLSSSRITLKLFRAETLEQRHNFLLEIPLLGKANIEIRIVATIGNQIIDTHSTHFVGTRTFNFHLEIAVAVALSPSQILIRLDIIFISFQFPIIIALRSVISLCCVSR